MLINTVLLFLQSALPVFIIISLLVLRFATASVKIVTGKKLILMSVLAITLAFVLSQYMEKLSKLFDGKGTELVFSLSNILIYICCALLFLLDNKDLFIKVRKLLALVVFLLVCSLYGSHFILFLSSYWAQSSMLELAGFESLFIGIILGIGICVSFAILLYFFLRYCDKCIYSKVSCYFLLLFATGQLMQSIALLQQVDILPLSDIVWNSTNLIAEKSEFGQLLQVLFGYETTPSYMQLIIYMAAFMVPFFISKSRCFVRLAFGEKS